jgi:ribosome biogenesis GTP-binding protein YlqF
MAKTRRMISENLKDVDLTIELLDARIPKSSENPEIARLVASKPKLTLLSKASLADPAATEAWKKHFASIGRECIFYDCRTGEGISAIAPAARKLCEDRLERYRDKGMEGRKLRAMIVGIPNVGKSSLINRLSSTNKAKVENRPGVTLNKQWITTSLGIDLLDMPGILWPKFDDQRVGENLALTGAIRDEIMDIESHNVDKMAKGLGILNPWRWQLIRKTSRDNARTPMQWSAAPGAGFTAGKPWLQINKNHTAINVQADRADPDGIFAFYQKAIALKKSSEVLLEGDFTQRYAKGSVYIFTRALNSKKLTAVCNFSSKTKKLPLSLTGKTLLCNYPDGAAGLRPWEFRLIEE